jgi:hypothetical protein
MRIKVIVFNRRAKSIEQFEDEVRSVIAQGGEVIDMSLTENGSADIILQLVMRVENKVSQDVVVMGLTDLATVESGMNEQLRLAEETGRVGRFMKILSLAKSTRALGILVVGESMQRGTESSASQAEEQNKKPNAKANRRAKTGAGGSDRGTTQQ